jgi:NADH:ubiquinone oxidoreductase subunit F (NADH-binding)
VLCNADEGDPGAFMDRSILEADPHAVLEGMIIAAKAIDAHKGYIYARTEYPLAIKRLGIAIDQAKDTGCWVRTSWARNSLLTSRSTRAPAPLSAAKRPP